MAPIIEVRRAGTLTNTHFGVLRDQTRVQHASWRLKPLGVQLGARRAGGRAGFFCCRSVSATDVEGGRHLSNAPHEPPEPPLDLSERLAARAEGWRAKHPVPWRRAAAARRILLWLSLPVLVVAAVAVPSSRHSFAVLAGLLYLLWQVFVLARSKTLSWAAYARAFSIAALVAPVIGRLEVLMGRSLGWEPAEQAPTVLIAGPVEETLKLWPLALLLWAARQRVRRMALVDFGLIGLAAGAGFQLAEDTIRRVVHAADEQSALGVLLVELLGAPDASTRYGVFRLLPGHQDFGSAHFAGHGVLTALVALGIGIALRARSRRMWLLPGGLWFVATFDHMMVNYAATAFLGDLSRTTGEAFVEFDGWVLGIHRAIGAGHVTGLLFLVLLAAAVVGDYRSLRAVGHRLPPLPGAPQGERAGRWLHGRADAAPVFGRAATRAAGALDATADAIPTAWHEIVVTAAAAGKGPPVWFGAMAALRRRRELGMGLAVAGNGPRRRRPPEPDVAASSMWLSRAVAAAACLIVAAAFATGVAGTAPGAFLAGLFDALGAWWSDLSLLQQILIVAGLAGLLGLAGMAWVPALGIASGAATVAEHGRGIAAFIRDPKGATREFLENLTPGQLLGYGLGLALERLVPAGVGAALGRRARRAAGEAVEEAGGRAAREGTEEAVDEAGDRVGREATEETVERAGRETAESFPRERVEELADDPSVGGITDKTLREAEVGLSLEQRGTLRGPIRRDPDGFGEFIDADDVVWDVKAFHSGHPKGFELNKAMRNITREIRVGEKVIVDTLNMSEEHVRLLEEAITQQGLSEHVVFHR
jgi:RsiW-degrading membrane proteinase PrsW (M82 family)